MEAHLAPRDSAEVGVFAVMIVVADLFSVFVPHVQLSAAGPAVQAQTDKMSDIDVDEEISLWMQVNRKSE